MKKFENIMIASDLDGTFLSNETLEVPRNIERIKYFTENGGIFTFATGRIAAHFTRRLPNARDYVNFPIVSCNGMVLFDLVEKREVVERFVSSALVCKTVEFLYEKYPEIAFRALCKEGVIYFQGEHPKIKSEAEESCMPMHYLDFEKWAEAKIYKLTLRASGEILAAARRDIEERFAGQYTLSLSWHDLLELQPSGISKASMLSEIKEQLSRERGFEVKLYAVGDYENDLEMLALADVAVCPDNAIDSVKKICDLCLCNNNEGVIADLVDLLDENIT